MLADIASRRFWCIYGRDDSVDVKDLEASRLARAASLVSFLALCWTVVLVVSGGVRVHLASFPVSSRNPYPCAIVAAIAYALSFFFEAPGRRSRPWVWLRDRIDRASPLLALAAVAGVLWLGLTYGARVGGGADSFGYVSQAYLWMKGELHVSEPLAAEAPWPRAGESFAPLGYRKGASPQTMVPAYPSGLPLIMAAFHGLAGACGVYYVGPVFGTALVAIVFVLSFRLTNSALTSALAALFMASSPAFLFNQMVPMSDAVAAALWLAALLALTWPRVAHAAVAGCLAGAAALVRPNLVPLALAGVAAGIAWGRPEPGRTSRPAGRAIAFAAGVTAGVIAVAVINLRLYASPWLSGYGSLSALYAVRHAPSNLVLYARWLAQSETLFMLLALPALAIARPRWLTVRTAVPLAAFALILCLSYLFYLTFDHWMFLRFLLPGFPLLFLLVAATLTWVVHVTPAPLAVPALGLAVVLLVHQRLDFVLGQLVLEMGAGEQRFLAVARYVERELPPNAVLLAKQHTGTIRFYSGRTTIQYEAFEPPRLNPAIEWLTVQGRRPFIVLEDWEEVEFRRRFGDQGRVGRLEIPTIAEIIEPVRVRVFDPLAMADRPTTRIVVERDPGCTEPSATWGDPGR